MIEWPLSCAECRFLAEKRQELKGVTLGRKGGAQVRARLRMPGSRSCQSAAKEGAYEAETGATGERDFALSTS
jgi:hypothetical protein